jgi:hypothetical protein
VDEAGVVGLAGAAGVVDGLALASAVFVSLPAVFSDDPSVLLPASEEVVPFASALLLAGLAEE